MLYLIHHAIHSQRYLFITRYHMQYAAKSRQYFSITRCTRQNTVNIAYHYPIHPAINVWNIRRALRPVVLKLNIRRARIKPNSLLWTLLFAYFTKHLKCDVCWHYLTFETLVFPSILHWLNAILVSNDIWHKHPIWIHLL